MYDARPAQPLLSPENAITFGGLLAAVLLFAGILLWPHGSPSASASPGGAPAALSSLSLSGKDGRSAAAERHLVALARLDPAAAGQAAQLRGDDFTKHMMEASIGVLERDQAKLSSLTLAQGDAMLGWAEEGLRMVRSRAPRYCSTRTLEGLQSKAGSPDALRREFAGHEDALLDYAHEGMALVLQAAAEGGGAPAGPLTPADEAALQGLAMSLMTNPEVQGLMGLAQGGAVPDADLCGLGLTVTAKFKQLPDGTRRRLYAGAGTADASSLSALPF